MDLHRLVFASYNYLNLVSQKEFVSYDAKQKIYLYREVKADPYFSATVDKVVLIFSYFTLVLPLLAWAVFCFCAGNAKFQKHSDIEQGQGSLATPEQTISLENKKIVTDFSDCIKAAKVAGNVDCIYQARIIGLLEIHQTPAHADFHRKLIDCLATSQVVVLLEDLIQKASLPHGHSLTLEAWDLAECIDMYKKMQETHREICVIESSLLLSQDEKILNAQEIALQAFARESLACESFRSGYSSGHIAEALKKAIEDKIDDFYRSSFGSRQSSLIEKILNYVENGERHPVIFIAGFEHGNRLTSAFKDEVARLEKALSPHNFLILDPANLEIEKS